MIQCELKHLEARCKERGYTLDEVRPCIASEDGEFITVDETHPAYPRTSRYITRDDDSLSWLYKARNFAKAAAAHVAAGMPTCSDDEIARRHDICTGCEFFKDNSCIQCGCPVVRDRKFISKLAWADQSCPVGKWGPVES